MHIVDTDVVADYLYGRLDAVQLVRRLEAAGEIVISVITLAELYEGVYFGRDPKQAERIRRTFLQGVSVLSINRTMARRFAMIRGTLRRRGTMIGDADLLIAVTALYYDVTLVTRNRKDFERVPGLRLLPPG